MANQKGRSGGGSEGGAGDQRDRERDVGGGSMARRPVSETGGAQEQEPQSDVGGGSMARRAVADAQGMSALVQAKESVEDELLQRPGVTGVDVGYKQVGGQRTDQIAIRVLVAQKRDVPAAERIPASINGIPTDVIERSFVLHRAAGAARDVDVRPMADTGRYNPVRGGISIGPCRAIAGFVYTGTLGAIARDTATGNTVLLSNFHVMCVDNGWAVGNTMAQPSRVDTGSCPADVVGTLQRAVLSASVDGAICSLSGRTHACEIADIGAVTGTAAATVGMAVRKRGRTTGLSHGIVDSISLSVNVPYGDGIGTRTLTNQIGIEADTAQNAVFGISGDSGSTVVNAARQVVGLYFAGTTAGDYGVANPIAAVLSELAITLCVTPAKPLIKDLKREKIEIKELKREKAELKELKREKIEIKELKREKFEKLEIKEIKERKPEKQEFEAGPKPRDFDPGPGIPGFPRAELEGGEGLEERVAQLEHAIGELAAFITPEQRPDLGAGALSREGDAGADVSGIGQQLEKQAGDAMQAKVNFDTKAADR
jgi:hypothetical protein